MFDAVANEVENVAHTLRTNADHPAFVYVVGFNQRPSDARKSMEELQALANDPAAKSFDPKQPQGLALMTNTPEDFWPAFQKVREEIVRQATIR